MSDSYEKLIQRRVQFWSDIENSQKMLDRLRAKFHERHKNRTHVVMSLEVDKTLAPLSTMQRRLLFEVAKKEGFRSVSAYLRSRSKDAAEK